MIRLNTVRLHVCRKERALVHIRLSENFRAVFYAPFYASLGHLRQESLDVRLITSLPDYLGLSVRQTPVEIGNGEPQRILCIPLLEMVERPMPTTGERTGCFEVGYPVS